MQLDNTALLMAKLTRDYLSLSTLPQGFTSQFKMRQSTIVITVVVVFSCCKLIILQERKNQEIIETLATLLVFVMSIISGRAL